MSDDPKTSLVRGVLDPFKSSPVLLSILLLNVVMLGGLGYILLQVAQSRQTQYDQLHDNQNRMYDDIMRLCFDQRREHLDPERQAPAR
jgi:cytoskeletal protein RodZ